MAATERKRASRPPRSGTTSPFHSTVPSKSMAMLITTGGVGGAAAAFVGSVSWPEWVGMGMVMISMISSTSITSISGVVLMSTITSGSPLPPLGPTLIAITFVLPDAFHAQDHVDRHGQEQHPADHDQHTVTAPYRRHLVRIVQQVLAALMVDPAQH